MASLIPNTYKARLWGDASEIPSPVDLEKDTIKCMLLTTSHTPDKDADVFIDDVSTNEVSASGSYTAGGILMSVTCSTDDTNDRGVFDATDITITSYTGSPAYAIIYRDTGTTSTSPIIAEIDFGGAQAQTNGTITISWHADGVAYIGE